jgi:predicted DNA-binding transcriptional regulator YafY
MDQIREIMVRGGAQIDWKCVEDTQRMLEDLKRLGVPLQAGYRLDPTFSVGGGSVSQPKTRPLMSSAQHLHSERLQRILDCYEARLP